MTLAMERVSERRFVADLQQTQQFVERTQQRKHGRYRFAFFVSMAPSRSQDFIDGSQIMEHEMASVQDISGGGISLISQLSLPVASAVDLRISLDGRTVETVGRVLGRQPMRSGYGYHYRIAFEAMCHLQQDVLSRWIEQAVQGRFGRTG